MLRKTVMTHICVLKYLSFMKHKLLVRNIYVNNTGVKLFATIDCNHALSNCKQVAKITENSLLYA